MRGQRMTRCAFPGSCRRTYRTIVAQGNPTLERAASGVYSVPITISILQIATSTM
jgi:hypothetical protein